ncbi:MAG: aldolase/citrate lyase family protein [Caulobacteraceae bacterium]
MPDTFRERLLRRELLAGAFIKTPTTHTTEIVGGCGFDFVVIDQEHAPFDRVVTDAILLAARACGIAALVRTPTAGHDQILGVLDDGAAGVLAPHISTPAKAKALVDACRYQGGRRGFSNTTRAGGFGATGYWEHVKGQDAEVVALAMIEDPEALDVLDAILDTPGLDGVFIGRGDLTVSMGASGPDAPEVRATVEKIAAAAGRRGMPVCAFVGTGDSPEVRWLKDLGVTAFIIASDQTFLRRAALAAISEFEGLKAK